VGLFSRGELMEYDIGIKIAQLAGTPFCVASEDGQKVYEVIATALREGKRVGLSFEGVTDLTTAFLNAAVGQLYNRELPVDSIPSHLGLLGDVSDSTALLLQRVVRRAKEYYEDPESFQKAAVAVLGEEDD